MLRKRKLQFYKPLFLLIAMSFLLGACGSIQKTTILNVAEYDILMDTRENTTAKINRLIGKLDNSAPVKIIFPKGRYDFYPDSSYLKDYSETNTWNIGPKRLAVFIEKKKNITIDAKGSDFVFHGHIQPFTLDNAKNIVIKNVNIDWDKPLTAESEVIEADSTHVILKIDTAQFPYRIEKDKIIFNCQDGDEAWKVLNDSWLIEFDKNHVIPAYTGDHGCFNGDMNNVVYENLRPGIVQLNGKFTKFPTVGNHLVMRHSKRDHAGLFLLNSKNIQLENINVYHTSGLGILSQYSENIDLKKVNMIPNPAKNRYLSGHDDGFHFMGCKGKITIDSCNFQGLMDDPINIHGTYAPVIERVNDKTLKCKFAHEMSTGLIWGSKGDVVGFVDNKPMNTIGKGILNKFTAISRDTFLLEFTASLPAQIQKGYAIENLTCTPSATITNCFVGSCRARGFLISTPRKVVVENNVFETSGSALLIAGDANYWFESGAITNLTIKNNTFRAPCNSSSYQFCEAVISIFPEIPEPNSKLPYHKNITIEGNTFYLSDYPLVYALSVNGLTFKDNTIIRSDLFTPWHHNKQTFTFDACKNVTITENNIGENVLGKNVLLKRMGLETLTLQKELKIAK